MATIADLPAVGSFPYAVAKLVQPGAVRVDASDAPISITDVWAFWLRPGERPGISDIPGVKEPDGIPDALSSHPAWPSLRRGEVTYRSAAEMSGSVVWFAEVEYGRHTTKSSHSSGGSSPVTVQTRIVERSWPVYEVQADFTTDAISTDPVLNSAGEPFDSVPQIKQRWLGARVKRAESRFPTDALALDNTVNQAETTVLGVRFPEHSARLEVSVEDTLAVGSESRYLVTYDIVPCHNFTPPASGSTQTVDRGWDLPILETGFRYRDGDGALVRATVEDESGGTSPSPQPVLLDENGALLGQAADPVFRVWSPYAEADWEDLGLPSTPTEGDDPPSGGGGTETT
jgi:hypothetical protein